MGAREEGALQRRRAARADAWAGARRQAAGRCAAACRRWPCVAVAFVAYDLSRYWRRGRCISSGMPLFVVVCTRTHGRAVSRLPLVPRGQGLPAKEAPPNWMLDLFGRVLIAALRPNVAKACKFVYPNRPEAADERLVTNIVRDSKDPGGYSVIAAGAKLPVTT